MQQLLPLVTQLLIDLWNLLAFLLQDVMLPNLPLLGWILFWLFAVNWARMRETLLSGAWIGLFLIGFTTIVTWAAIAPPVAGTHNIAGLSVSNVVGKTVYVTMLFSIMFLCGAVQLSGCCGGFTTGDAESQDEQAAEA